MIPPSLFFFCFMCPSAWVVSGHMLSSGRAEPCTTASDNLCYTLLPCGHHTCKHAGICQAHCVVEAQKNVLSHRTQEMLHRSSMLLSVVGSLSRYTALSPTTPAGMQHAYRRLKRARDQEKSRFQSHDVLHSRYLLMNLLGKGGFSEVYKVRYPEQHTFS